MVTPNLNIAREPRGALRLYDASRSVEDDASMNVGDNASTGIGPSATFRIFRASAVVSFVVLVGIGGALYWRSYGDYARDMIRVWAQPAAPPVGFAELQEQLKSIAIDLAAVRHAIEQLSTNQDQLTRQQGEMTRTQEQMSQSIALQAAKQELSQKLSSPPPGNKPVTVAPPKPVPPHTSSKPLHLQQPQSLQPQQ
jgi:hypothetical protein